MLSEPKARGSLQRPTRANWFPTIKSGFDASFSKREYIRTRFAPSSLYTSAPWPSWGGMMTLNAASVEPDGLVNPTSVSYTHLTLPTSDLV